MVMPARTPEDRSLVAQIAAAERWGRTPDRTAATAPARAGLRAKFARQVDPHGTLDPAEVERRVDHLVHAHMLRMSLKAKAARRKVKEATATAEQAEAELKAMAGGQVAS
jgi:phage FluMu protein gp41